MPFTQSFEITKWDQSHLRRGRWRRRSAAPRSTKSFADGDLVGTSSAELLMVGTPTGPAAYTAVERFTGTLAGRDGSFVMVHGATADEDVVPRQDRRRERRPDRPDRHGRLRARRQGPAVHRRLRAALIDVVRLVPSLQRHRDGPHDARPEDVTDSPSSAADADDDQTVSTPPGRNRARHTPRKPSV